MGADGVSNVKGDGIQSWCPEGTAAPEAPRVRQGVTEAEEDETAR